MYRVRHKSCPYLRGPSSNFKHFFDNFWRWIPINYIILHQKMWKNKFLWNSYFWYGQNKLKIEISDFWRFWATGCPKKKNNTFTFSLFARERFKMRSSYLDCSQVSTAGIFKKRMSSNGWIHAELWQFIQF